MLSRLVTMCPAKTTISSPTLQLRLIGVSAGMRSRFGPRTTMRPFEQFTKAFEGKAQPTLRERLLGPTTGKPFIIGTYALVGASALGIGMLCYYGAGAAEAGSTALDRSAIWPQYIRDRVQTTYTYLAGGLAATAGAGYAVARSPALLSFASNPSLMFFMGSLVLIIGSGYVVRSLDYRQNSGAKHVAWLAHCGILGGVLAPMCLLGGPVLIRAAWYTAGVVAGLSAIAMTAPSERFLNMAGPLGMGLGVVLAANVGSFFFSPHTAIGAGLASVVIYGGLILFGAFLLHDTQRVIKASESTGYYAGYGNQHIAVDSYDPINAQMAIYLDVLNIFIRIAMIMGMGGGGRKK